MVNKKAIAKTTLAVFSLILVLSLVYYGVSVLASGPNPVASFGTNPVDSYNTSNPVVVFDLKCSAFGAQDVTNLSLWGNWNGTWQVNQTNSNPINNTWWNVTVTGIPQGKNHKWAVSCYDTANLSNMTDNRTFNLDTTAPTITLPFYTNATMKKNTDSLTLNVSVVDSGSGASYCSINTNGINQTIAVSNNWCNTTIIALTGLTDGNKTINVYANDTVQNTGLNDAYAVWIDSTAPTYSSSSTNSTYAGQEVLHSLYWQDNYALAGYIFSFDNGNGTFLNDTWTSMTGTGNWSNVTKLVNSTIGSIIQWRIWANDSVGNLGVSSTYSYATLNGSMITVTLNLPNDNDYLNSESVNFNCSAAQGNGLLTNVSLYGNWSGWGNKSTNNMTGISNSTTFTQTLTANAIYKYNCLVCDSNDLCNFSSTNNIFIIDDGTDLDVTLNNPDDGSSTASTSIDFEYIVSDDYGIKNCSLYLDGIKKGTNSSDVHYDGSTVNTFSESGLSVEDHSWYVICYDLANNMKKSSTWSFTITSSGSGSGNSDTTTTTVAADNSLSLGNLTDLSFSKIVPGLSSGDVVKFLFQNTNHTLAVINVTTSSAAFRVSSTPVTFILGVNQSEGLDLDGNGKNDFSITLVDITSQEAKILLKPILEAASLAIARNLSNGNLTANNTASKGFPIKLNLKSWKIVVIILVVLVIILMFVLITIYNKKKKKKNFWRKK